MPLFTTLFTPPAAIEDLTAVAIGGIVVLEWSPSTLDPEDFTGYRVSRSLTGQPDEYVELAQIADQSVSTYTDYSAPIGRTLFYRVTQSDLDYESEPAEVTTALSECVWWLVAPAVPGASLEIPNVTGYESEWPVQSAEHEPIGRPAKLVETGLVLAEEGSITAFLEPAHDPSVLLGLRAAAGGSTEILLKTPYGEVFSVVVETMKRERQPDGYQTLSFRFVGVG